MRTSMWINGEAVAPSGEARNIINPADQSILADVSDASAEDVCTAVSAARRAFFHSNHSEAGQVLRVGNTPLVEGVDEPDLAAWATA